MASDSQDGSNKGSGDDETMDEIGGLFGVSSDSSGDDGSEDVESDEPRESDAPESAEGGGQEEEAAQASDSGDEQADDEKAYDGDESGGSDPEAFDEPSTGDEAGSSAVAGDGGGSSGDGEKVEIPRELIENLAESDQVGDDAKEKLRGVLDDPGEVDDREELADQLHDLAEAVKEGDVSGDELTAQDGGSTGGPTDEATDAAETSEAEPEDDEETLEADEASEGSTLEAEQDFGSEPDDAVGGVFSPGGGGGGGDDFDVDDDLGGESYLDEDDLGGYEESETSSTVYILAGVVVVLLAVVGYVVAQTETGTRLYHLFKGDLKQYERMQAKKKEEKLRKKMIANFPKFGTLTLSGKPKYARMKLDGQIWYGKTPESGEWKELRLTTPNTKFQNLDVEEKHELEVIAPGHKSKDWTLTEEKWNPVGDSNIEHQKKIDVSLDPAGESLEEQKERQKEFMQRLEKDPENNYNGEVTIETKPEGAKVIFDTEPLKDENGEELKTPVTFSKYYVENEKTGELEENEIRVDTPPDRGHKIQLRMPEEKGDYPKYVSPLERQMWRCEWKDESERKQIPDDAPLPKHCNYKFKLSLDFDGLKDYIEKRKKRKKEIKEQTKEMKKKRKEIRKGME